jgi:hypothetical protein
MRTRAFRRHQTDRHMWRRLKEDRNQHYNELDCPCWTDPRAMARLKEQPKMQCACCSNPRRGTRYEKPRRTLQEYRWLQDDAVGRATRARF